MYKIPVYLITGFLGSGKTTLIQNLLNKHFENQKLAVIQNEFAPHNFDGTELKRKTTREFNMLEVNNGSVFCVCLLAGFISSLKRFVNKINPDIILFEASGLSDPIAMGEIFNSPELADKIYLASIIAIVDSTSFLKLDKLQMRMVHQVQVANKILVNKIDLETNIQPTLEKIQKINPHASVCQTSYCDIVLEDLIQTENNNNHSLPFQISAEDLGRPDIKSAVVKTTKSIKKTNYKAFLNELSRNMIRMKGYLLLDSGETISFQYAAKNMETIIINRLLKQTEIIGMGYNLSASEVKKIYTSFSI